MWLHLRRLLELELSVCNNFWHTYYWEYTPSTGAFIFPPYFYVYLLYFGKLSRPKYLWKIKQNHKNFTGRWDSDLKSLSVKKVWCMKDAQWISWQWLEGRKHRIHKTGTIVRQPRSGRPHSSRSSGGPCAQSGGQASNDVVLSCCLKPIISPVSLSDKQSYRLQ